MNKELLEFWQKRMDYPLSSEDIKKILNNQVKILTYNNLKYFHSINQLVHPFNNCVILYEWGEGIGHWTCLLRHQNSNLDFFDPYGYMPDDERSFMPDNKWETNYLSQLLALYKGKVFYNEHQLQSKNSKISTCGRWVVARLLNKHIPLDDWTKCWMKEKYRDFLITICTDKYL